MEDALYRAGVPSGLFRRGGDAFLRETGGDVIGEFPRQKFCVDAPDDDRFLLYDFHLAVRRSLSVTEEVGIAQAHFAVREPLALAPCGVVADVLGKAAHRFGKDQINFSGEGVRHHLIEPVPLFHAGAGDSGVRIDPGKNPLRVTLDVGGVIVAAPISAAVPASWSQWAKKKGHGPTWDRALSAMSVYAYRNRPFGVGTSLPSSWAVSIHSRAICSTLVSASWAVGPSAIHPASSGTSAI